jgi:uncharacterized membrane protein YozB (DUF420 family)
MTTLVFQIQSLLIVLLMVYGVLKAKKNRLLHRKIMLSAILWDLFLILQIELTRSAIAKAASALDKPHQTLFYIHLFFAISTVLLYPLAFYSGQKIIKNNSKHTRHHKVIGGVVLLFRISTLFTSYFVVAARG